MIEIIQHFWNDDNGYPRTTNKFYSAYAVSIVCVPGDDEQRGKYIGHN